MNRVIRDLAGAMAVLALAVTAGCGSSGQDEAAGGGGSGSSADVIKVGYVGTLSGPVSFLGTAPLEGVELAVEQLNGSPEMQGHTFEVIAEDDKLDPSQAVSATQKLISNSQVDVVIGSPHSGMSLAMIPITEAAEVVQISPLAAAPDLTEPVKPYFFRVWNTDTNISQVLSKFAADNYEKVGLLYETSAFGEGGRKALEAAFEALGSELVASEAFDLDAQDLTPQLTALRDAGARAIIVQTQGPQAALAARGLRQLDYDVPIIGHPGLAQQGFVKLAQGAAEGTIVFGGLDRDKPAAEEFISAYEAEHGSPPFSFYQATGYDAVMVIAEALKSVDFDTSKLQSAMESMQGFEGVVGRPESTISYSASDHDGYGPDALIPKQVEGDKLAPVGGP